MADDRFVNIQQTDTSEFVEKMKSTNTKRKTESDLKIFKNWLSSVGEVNNPEDIEITVLNVHLARFFLSVRTKSREDYEPDSLKCMQSPISRYLSEKGDLNIMKDKEFQHSRDVLAAKRKELKGKGIGNKKRRADPYTSDEIETLYSHNLLGTSNPKALTNTIWINNCLHFGMRGRQEHTDMLFGDLSMKATSDGKQYLEYCERETKTRKGESGNTRSFAPKMFEILGDPRCPVQTFMEFIKRRPVDTFAPESRMYLSSLHDISPDSTTPLIKSVWHSRQAIGKNKLGKLAKTTSQKAGLTGRKVNHSPRKTTVTSLLHSKVEQTQIMQLTRHRNVQSINQYSSAFIDQQETMSNILSDISCGNRGVVSNNIANTCFSPQPSTSKHTPITTAEPSSDDDMANIDIDGIMSSIQNYENQTPISICNNFVHSNVMNTTSALPTVIDLPPMMPKSRVTLFPYANIKGNVTINVYGINDKNLTLIINIEK